MIFATALVLTLATCDEGTTSVQGGYEAVREEGIALLKSLEQKSKDEETRNEIERQNASLFSRFVSLRVASEEKLLAKRAGRDEGAVQVSLGG